MVTRPRYRHFDDLWRKSRQAMPPRCGQPAGGGFDPVTPDRGPDARFISEWAIVDEKHSRRATPPVSGSDTAVDRVPAQSGLLCLRKSDDAVLPT
jgi:hypothetical protein